MTCPECGGSDHLVESDGRRRCTSIIRFSDSKRGSAAYYEIICDHVYEPPPPLMTRSQRERWLREQHRALPPASLEQLRLFLDGALGERETTVVDCKSVDAGPIRYNEVTWQMAAAALCEVVEPKRYTIEHDRKYYRWYEQRHPPKLVQGWALSLLGVLNSKILLLDGELHEFNHGLAFAASPSAKADVEACRNHVVARRDTRVHDIRW